MDNVFSSFSENYEFDGDFDNVVVSYDTSCLLNLYRCSEKSRKEMLDMFSRVDKVFGHVITHHVAVEFSFNKDSAKKDIYARYKNIEKSFVGLKNIIAESLKLDGLDTPLKAMDEEIKPLTNKIQEILHRNKRCIGKEAAGGNIFDSIAEIFSGKVLPGYEHCQLREISKVGEDRFSKNIPPGFEDEGKSDYINVGGYGLDRKFGDLIVWLQLIDYSKSSGKNIIFITSDGKDDWFSKSGKRKNIRPDLAHEFFSETKKKIYCYSLGDFESRFKKDIDFKFSDEIKAELKEIENESKTWLEDILTAFEHFGGEASLQEVYDYIEESDRRLHSVNWKVTVRRTIYNHSSSVNAYLGKEDIFERKSKGLWRIR